MAEPDNGGSSSSPPQKPKELSMEKRLLLAFVLMGAVLFTTPYFFKSAPAAGEEDRNRAAQEWDGRSAPRCPAAPAAAAVGSRNAAAGAAPVAAAQKEELFTVDTECLSHHLFQQGRGGAELAAQEVFHRRQAPGTGQHRIHGGFPVRPGVQRRAARRSQQCAFRGPARYRTASASPTSFPTAT